MRLFPAGSLAIRVAQLYAAEYPPFGKAFAAECARPNSSGSNLFPGLTGPSLTHGLRSVARHFGWEGTERLLTRSIRAGATRANLESGGSFAQSLKAGQWHS